MLKPLAVNAGVKVGAKVGANISEIDTPAMLVDLDLVESNITRLFKLFDDRVSGRDSNRVSGRNIAVRPHLKTVKSPVFAQMLLNAGAAGVCVAKVSEAEIMAAAGISDILITTEIVGEAKLKRLAQLLEQPGNLITVVVDSKEGADALNELILATTSGAAKPLAVLIEVNVGQNRCGVEPGQEVLELANYINKRPGLHLVGLQGYEGHLQHVTPPSERRSLCLAAMSKLEDTVKLLNENSIEIETVTTGGTGTAVFCSESPVITEVQPGSFIFMDTSYQAATEGIYDSALSILTTVISKPKPNRAVVDAGTKSLSTDMGNAQPKNQSRNNQRTENPGAKHLDASDQILYRPAGDEHGILECLKGDLSIAIGDRIEILPSHIDTTINLHDVYICHRQGTIEQIVPITARGKVQ